MPKYNFSDSIVDLTTGRNFQRQVAVDLITKDVVIAALLVQTQVMSEAEKRDRADLAERIHYAAGPIDLNDHDVELIKKATGEASPTPFLRAVLKALEPPVLQ